MAQLIGTGFAKRLHPDHPCVEAEVIYAVRHEFAQRAADVLVRRTGLALLDQAAAQAATARVIELMAGELGWSPKRRGEEQAGMEQRLREGL